MSTMTPAEAAEVLRKHNAWRRDNNDETPQTEPALLGKAIDAALVHLASHAERIKADESAVPVATAGEFIGRGGSGYAVLFSREDAARIGALPRGSKLFTSPPAQAAQGDGFRVGSSYNTLPGEGRNVCTYKLEWVDHSEQSCGVALWRNDRGLLHLQNLSNFSSGGAPTAELVAQGQAIDWPSPSERNPSRTMRGEFCSLIADLQREWMREGAEDGSDAIDAAYEALHQFVSRIATHPHSPDAADSGRVTEAMVSRAFTAWNESSFTGGAGLRARWRESIEAALAAQGHGEATKHWHDLYRAECRLRQDDAARYGQRIIDLESASPASPAGVPDGWRELIEWCATTAGTEVNGNQLSAKAKQLLAAPSATSIERKWTGPGHLEETGYVDSSATPEGGEVK